MKTEGKPPSLRLTKGPFAPFMHLNSPGKSTQPYGVSSSALFAYLGERRPLRSEAIKGRSNDVGITAQVSAIWGEREVAAFDVLLLPPST